MKNENCNRCSHPTAEHTGASGACTHPMPRRTVCPCNPRRKTA